MKVDSDESVVAFVPVRLSSTRLPRKHLREIGGRPMLSWVLDRIRAVPEVERIVVCVPNEPESSDPLIAFCLDEGVDIFLFSGDGNDVVGRLHAAAVQFAARICVMVSGDCPLAAPDVLSLMLRELLSCSDVGWVTLQKTNGEKTIHEGLVVARVEVWAEADRLSNQPELREHQFPILWRRPDLFSGWVTRSVIDFEKYDVEELRISVDTPADLEFMRQVWSVLRQRNEPFDLEHVLLVLKQQPNLRLINRHVHQRTLNDDPLSALFVVTAVGDYGYGNIFRSFEIADELVERWGASAQFFVTDDAAEKLCMERGFRSKVVDIANTLDQAIQSPCNIVVFDVNCKVTLPIELIRTLQLRGLKVAIIDNVCEAAQIADTVVIPTVHHVGPLWPHASTGSDFVVIRKSIRRFRTPSRAKENLALIYPGKSSLAMAKAAIADLTQAHPGIQIELVSRLRPDFEAILACSKFVVCPLSQTAYEGTYLGAIPVLLREECYHAEESQFIKSSVQVAECDGEGAKRIGHLLVTTIRGRSQPQGTEISAKGEFA